MYTAASGVNPVKYEPCAPIYFSHRQVCKDRTTIRRQPYLILDDCVSYCHLSVFTTFWHTPHLSIERYIVCIQVQTLSAESAFLTALSLILFLQCSSVFYYLVISWHNCSSLYPTTAPPYLVFQIIYSWLGQVGLYLMILSPCSDRPSRQETWSSVKNIACTHWSSILKTYQVMLS